MVIIILKYIYIHGVGSVCLYLYPEKGLFLCVSVFVLIYARYMHKQNH